MTFQYAILAIFVTFALIEAKNGKFFRKESEVKSDGYVEIIGSLMLFMFTQPLILFTSAFLMGQALPEYAGGLILLLGRELQREKIKSKDRQRK